MKRLTLIRVTSTVFWKPNDQIGYPKKHEIIWLEAKDDMVKITLELTKYIFLVAPQ